MNKYRIIDDSGVDYNFLGKKAKAKGSWVGQIVKGAPNPSLYPNCVTVEKPFGLGGTYSADACRFELVESTHE